MFSKVLSFFNTIFASVDFFNKKINQYKIIAKEPALPSYAYINWGLHLINSGKSEEGLEKLNQRSSKYYDKAKELKEKFLKLDTISYDYVPKNSLYTEFLGKK